MDKKIVWNEVWETEKNNDYWKIPDPDLVEFLKDIPGNVTTVLDLGCGIGRHSIYCAKQGFQVTAIDVSGNAIEHLTGWAKKENLAITTLADNIFSDAIKHMKFDLILSINVIYHGTRTEIQETIKGIHARLQSPGLFYFSFLSRDDDKYKVGREIEPHTFNCDTSIHKGDIHYFADEDDLKDLIKDFDIISLKKNDHEWEHKGEKRFSSFWKVCCRA